MGVGHGTEVGARFSLEFLFPIPHVLVVFSNFKKIIDFRERKRERERDSDLLFHLPSMPSMVSMVSCTYPD